MKRYLTLAASVAIFAGVPLSAQEAKTYPAPGEIVTAAKAEEWVAIAPSDLLVMDLAPDAKGKPRRVVIQLMPPPFSQGWVGNIRKLAAAKWWDGTSINRVQDNYVVQWGDATEKKPLPDSLAVMPESGYVSSFQPSMFGYVLTDSRSKPEDPFPIVRTLKEGQLISKFGDPYIRAISYAGGFPVAVEYGTYKNGVNRPSAIWPTHCYGMVGVGRNLSPDTGTGAELYTVIGHAPRHLDRNIALVGRVIEGMEHLSSLPRGTGALGFYETQEERVPILSVRLASEMATDKPQLAFEYLSTESESFARYAEARANRRDPFFITPAGGADICNIPVPVRRQSM